MANYLAEIMSTKAAIIECNDTRAFEIMSDLYMDREVRENHYIIGKVTYYFGVDLCDFFATFANRFEYVIIDFGNCIREFRQNTSRLKYRIIMGSVMPYRSVYHKELLENRENTAALEHSLHLLHGDEKNIKDYAAKKKINALPLPIIFNPYIIESKLANFFQLLF